MSRKKPSKKNNRRVYDADFKGEAVQMLLDGHSAQSIVERLGISGTNLLYRWKKLQLAESGPVGEVLDSRVQELESELRRVERERDVLKKALVIFGRQESQKFIRLRNQSLKMAECVNDIETTFLTSSCFEFDHRGPAPVPPRFFQAWLGCSKVYLIVCC